jgi:hypothetical protein
VEEATVAGAAAELVWAVAVAVAAVVAGVDWTEVCVAAAGGSEGVEQPLAIASRLAVRIRLVAVVENNFIIPIL